MKMFQVLVKSNILDDVQVVVDVPFSPLPVFATTLGLVEKSIVRSVVVSECKHGTIVPSVCKDDPEWMSDESDEYVRIPNLLKADAYEYFCRFFGTNNVRTTTGLKVTRKVYYKTEMRTPVHGSQKPRYKNIDRTRFVDTLFARDRQISPSVSIDEDDKPVGEEAISITYDYLLEMIGR